MRACASNNPTTYALLQSRGADLCAINDREMNVLHIAAFLSSAVIIHEVLNASLDDEIILQMIEND
jgi:hypothetical protein